MNIFINLQSDKGAPVLQAKKKQLGREAAGWNAAARELKTSVPAWVKRLPGLAVHTPLDNGELPLPCRGAGRFLHPARGVPGGRAVLRRVGRLQFSQYCSHIRHHKALILGNMAASLSSWRIVRVFGKNAPEGEK